MPKGFFFLCHNEYWTSLLLFGCLLKPNTLKWIQHTSQERISGQHYVKGQDLWFYQDYDIAQLKIETKQDQNKTELQYILFLSV